MKITTIFSIWNKRNIINGVHVNPELPAQFDAYPNERRPYAEVEDWQNRAYIRAETMIDSENNRVYLRFDIRCLDGGAWDRSTWKGTSESLEEAIRIAKNINEEYEKYGCPFAEMGGLKR